MEPIQRVFLWVANIVGILALFLSGWNTVQQYLSKKTWIKVRVCPKRGPTEKADLGRVPSHLEITAVNNSQFLVNVREVGLLRKPVQETGGEVVRHLRQLVEMPSESEIHWRLEACNLHGVGGKDIEARNQHSFLVQDVPMDYLDRAQCAYVKTATDMYFYSATRVVVLDWWIRCGLWRRDREFERFRDAHLRRCKEAEEAIRSLEQSSDSVSTDESPEEATESRRQQPT
jgi:hypothetical protein